MKIAPQTDQVIFGSVEALFDLRVGKDRGKQTQVIQCQRVDQIIPMGYAATLGLVLALIILLVVFIQRTVIENKQP